MAKKMIRIMAKKMIRPLRSEADYDAALNEIERYFENEPKPGTPEARGRDVALIRHQPITSVRGGLNSSSLPSAR
jgi:hypothetical protein